MSFESFGFRVVDPGERWCDELSSTEPVILGEDSITGWRTFVGDFCELEDRLTWITCDVARLQGQGRSLDELPYSLSEDELKLSEPNLNPCDRVLGQFITTAVDVPYADDYYPF